MTNHDDESPSTTPDGPAAIVPSEVSGLGGRDEIVVLLGDDVDDGDDDEPARVAFLGMGVMGAPMARHVARGGHSITVYNRTAAKALAWVALNGHGASPTPAEAAEDADVVMMCVGNDDDVRQVVFGATGVLTTMRAGSILVDHTTASAELARELAAACADRGVGFVDAPVSGGQAGAENGQLTVMCGCDDESVYEQVVPVIAHFAKSCVRLGDAGAGQLTKMVNQICIGGMIQGLAEAVNFAQRAGLDVEQVVDVISKGASQSWQMENRAITMAEGRFDFGFAVDWMRKDFGIVFDEAGRNGARLPVTALVDQFYAQIQQRGGERWDTSSLIDLLTNP